MLGLHGPNATLLGDAAVAHNAIALARDFLEWELADHVLVVAPHEHAAIMAKGYARFRGLFRGAPWSEGAGALLLTRGEGREERSSTSTEAFRSGAVARSRVSSKRRCAGFRPSPTSSRCRGASRRFPHAPAARVAIKDALGEAFAAGALWQIVFGLQRTPPGRHLLSTCVGLNEQVSVLLARR